ncbi:hypothetical protein C8R43DRAFT_1110730 [Mycena crocata]|nr:hypothetical protein C8R43DRAFT_1110730 [Mycena crocata]
MTDTVPVKVPSAAANAAIYQQCMVLGDALPTYYYESAATATSGSRSTSFPRLFRRFKKSLSGFYRPALPTCQRGIDIAQPRNGFLKILNGPSRNLRLARKNGLMNQAQPASGERASKWRTRQQVENEAAGGERGSNKVIMGPTFFCLLTGSTVRLRPKSAAADARASGDSKDFTPTAHPVAIQQTVPEDLTALRSRSTKCKNEIMILIFLIRGKFDAPVVRSQSFCVLCCLAGFEFIASTLRFNWTVFAVDHPPFHVGRLSGLVALTFGADRAVLFLCPPSLMSSVNPAIAQLFYVVLTSQLYTAAGALFFHGICLILFLFAAFFLVKTKNPMSRMFLILAVIFILFALSQAVLDLVIATACSRLLERLFNGGPDNEFLYRGQQLLRLYRGRVVVTTVNNTITACLFLYRCAVLWSSYRYGKIVIILPALLIGATTVAVCLAIWKADPLTPYPYALMAPFTAGRLWAKGREVTVLLGVTAARKYNKAVEIILDASLLYFVVILVLTISVHTQPVTAPLTNVTWGAFAQIVNILPLTIMARVGLANTLSQQGRQAYDVGETELEMSSSVP